MDLQAYQQFEEELFAILNKLDADLTPIRSSNPINLLEQKEIFLENPVKEPDFSYKDLDFDSLNKAEKDLLTLSPPEGILKKTYVRKIQYKINSFNFIKARGEREERIQLSKKLWPQPRGVTIKKAMKILEEEDSTPRSGIANLDHTDLIDAIDRMLEKMKVTGWETVLVSRDTMSISPKHKEIYIPRNRLYTEDEIQRLLIHEIGVHIRRSESANSQQLKIFKGFPNYIITEEGLALYFENKENLLGSVNLRKYAARVIAVSEVYNRKGFVEVFEKLRTHNISEDMSWQTASRAFRGGALLKDHVYLEGYYNVSRYLKRNPEDQEILFSGKIGIDDIELVREILE